MTDCSGVWGGPLKSDLCGVCGGTDSCIDCAGEIGGHSYVDKCGKCDDDAITDCVPSGCALLRTAPFYSTFEEEQETMTRKRISALRQHRNNTLTDLASLIGDKVYAETQRLSQELFVSFTGDVDNENATTVALELHSQADQLERQSTALSERLSSGHFVNCELISSWGYHYDLAKYRGLRHLHDPDPDGGEILFDLCGRVPIDAVPLLHRPQCNGLDTSAVVQIAGTPEELIVTGFDCTAGSYTDGVRFTLGPMINGRPSWVSEEAALYIYFSGGYWYLDSDLTPIAADEFSQGFWASIRSSLLVTCSAVDSEFYYPGECDIGGRKCPPCAPDDTGAMDQPTPVGLFAGWREYCGAQRYVDRTIDLNPGCAARPGSFYATESVLSPAVEEQPEPEPELGPIPCNLYGSGNTSSSNDSASCVTLAGNLTLETDLTDLVVYLLRHDSASRKVQFETELARLLANILTLGGGSVNQKDVRILGLRADETDNDITVVDVDIDVQVSQINHTIDAVSNANDHIYENHSNVLLGSFAVSSVSYLAPTPPNLTAWVLPNIEVPCENNPSNWHPVGLPTVTCNQ